jgi:hypothetical protein
MVLASRGARPETGWVHLCRLLLRRQPVGPNLLHPFYCPRLEATCIPSGRGGLPESRRPDGAHLLEGPASQLSRLSSLMGLRHSRSGRAHQRHHHHPVFSFLALPVRQIWRGTVLTLSTLTPPSEQALLVRHPSTAHRTPTHPSRPSPPLFDSSVLHTSLSPEHRPDSRSPALLPAHPPPTVESAR